MITGTRAPPRSMSRTSAALAAASSVLGYCVLMLALPLTGAAGIDFGVCRTPDGDAGLCLHITDCAYLYDMLQTSKNNASEREYLKSSQCGLDNTNADLVQRILVCCANNRNGPNSPTSTREPTATGTSAPGNVLPSPGVCGNILSNRILGGTETQLDEFPWIVLLSYSKPFNNSGFHCGGALINSRYVITAGHCVLNPSMPISWSLDKVRLGEWNTDTAPDCVVDRNGKKSCAPLHMDVPIETKIVHELYSPETIDQYNDVALLRLKNTVTYTDNIMPICLPLMPELRTDNYEGYAMDVAGWGVTETDEASSIKLKIVVNGWELSQCQNRYRSYQVRINASQLCAGGKQGIDTCRGDSGGPLMMMNRVDERDFYFILGIVSYGPKPCALEGWPGVYTRVAHYTDWIQKQLKP